MPAFLHSITLIFSPPNGDDMTTSRHRTESSRPARTRSGSPPSLGPSSEAPIYFYDSNKPYYELTCFSDYPVEYHGHIYPTAEHLFQAFKFMDVDPELARLHRQRADWLNVNIAMMDTVLEAKFSQHRSLRRLLRSTGSRQLIEDSPVHDSFWGIGSDGRGRNELGKALMRLRGD
ncbi:hypothetical protein BGW80DRAFT_1297325, partial [Lactifluus volemus]